jgi:hypothetical protein
MTGYGDPGDAAWDDHGWHHSAYYYHDGPDDFEHHGWGYADDADHSPHVTQFDLAHAQDHTLIGDPNDIQVWHRQSLPDDCGVVTQEYILNQLTGQHHTEAECVQTAMNAGLYTPGTGTYGWQIGGLLNAYGIPTDVQYGATLDDVRAQLDAHHKVIVSVDHSILQGNVIPGHRDDHVVQVVAVDDTDPANSKVILNNPGASNGQGEAVDARAFFEAWGPSGNLMMHTDDIGAAAYQPGGTAAAPYTPVYAGYMNSDGTYHWETDNSNRDCNTGAVVSWGAANHALGVDDHDWEKTGSGYAYERIKGEYTGDYVKL